MALTIIITAKEPCNNNSIFSHLKRNGWLLQNEDSTLFASPIDPVILNGRVREVEGYFRFSIKESNQSIAFIADRNPKKYYQRTAYLIYRKLAGKLVSDLLSTDMLPISQYLVEYTPLYM